MNRILLKAKFFTLFLLFFALYGNVSAQCTITGTKNATALNPDPCVTLSDCGGILYIGDGSVSSSLVINQNLDLSCLGAIQLIVRNNASLDFTVGNFDLNLAAGSSIQFLSGSSLKPVTGGTGCTGSDRIGIGGVKIANCNGNAGLTNFTNLFQGGYVGAAGAIGTSQIICSGETPAELTSIKDGTGAAPISYEWQAKTTGVYTTISGATSANYSPPTLVATTSYQRRTVSTSGNSPFTPSVTITVNERIGGTAPISPTIVDTNCSGSIGSVTLDNQNHALQFVKANNQYVRTSTAFLSNLTRFTMEGWIKYKTSDLNSGFTSLFGQNNVVEFGFENGQLHLYTKNGGFIYATPPVNFGDNTWHHIAAVGTGSQILIYADGVLVWSGGSGIGAGTYGSHTDNVNIGAGVFNSTGDFFGGQIMKVGFYNTALSATRIAGLAYSPITYTGTETGLIAGYNFLEGAGTILTSVPAGKNGTLMNTPTWIDPYTYAWTKTGTPAYTATTKNITGLSSGEYNLSFDIGKGCPRAVSYTIGTRSTEWNGSAWLPSLPTINDKLKFTGSYTSSGSISGCECEVVSGNVLIKSGDILTITNSVIVNDANSIPTSLTFENNASLIQVNDDAVNTGAIVYKRTTAPMKNYDYTYWSSPVEGQTAKALSPNTLADKYFRYSGGWVFDAGIMNPGVGFIIRTPKPATYGLPYPEVVTMPYAQPVGFKGKPNNKIMPLPIGATDGDGNLIGNPYPSAMSADAFLTANIEEIEGTIYFWTHNTVVTNLKYTASDYAVYNFTGGTTTGNLAREWNDLNFNGKIEFGEWIDADLDGILDPGELFDRNSDSIIDRGEWEDVNVNNKMDLGEWTDVNHNGTIDSGEWVDTNNNGILDQILTEKTSNKPSGNIAAGQSFFAMTKKGTGSTGSVVFKNSMRAGVANSNSQFFKGTNSKTAAIVKHRVWLNLSNNQGAFKQTLVGYVTGATLGYDRAFDGETFDGNKYIDFYSVNEGKNLVIQGRALPFDKTDKVPLGYKTNVEGSFAISIDEVDGVLTSQTVFVEDKVTNVIHNLKNGAYSFSTLKGVFNDRFVLRYMDNSVVVVDPVVTPPVVVDPVVTPPVVTEPVVTPPVVIPPVVIPPVILDPNQGANTTLGTDGFQTKGRGVVVSVKDRQIKINSFDETIGTVKVYDLRGRLLYQKEHVNKNEFVISNLDLRNQYLIVLTQLINGKWVTKEIIY